MPTRALHFNSSQGALTVFYDLIGEKEREPSSIVTYMEKVFPSQEYIYREVNDVPEYDEVIDDILTRRDNMDIILPASNRMIFCYYIDLADLTKDFIDRYYKMALELRSKQPPNNLTDQHHMVCFRFKVAGMEKIVIREKADLLIDLVNRDLSVSKEVFMLRTTALQRFENQENGLVESLFIQSRQNNTQYINARNNALRMVVYEDYYENRNARCNEGIQKIDEWFNNPSDPNLDRLKDAVKEEVLKALSELRVITRSFGRFSTLYPVHVDDFEPVKTLFFVTGYTSKIGRNHPILVERRNRMIEDKQEALRKGVNMTKIMEVVKDYHYPDLKKLSEEDTDLISSLVSDVLLDQRQKQPEEEKLAGEIITSIMEKIRDDKLVRKLDDPEDGIAIKKTRAKKLLQKERLSAGIYRNLDECLENIDEHARPNLINGIFGAASYKIAMINDNCYAKIQGDYNGIEGFDEAYNYDGIEPCEIAVTKVYDMVSLSGENAINRLLEAFE